MVLRLQDARREDVRADPAAYGIWQHSGLLPLTATRVSLGEGATPLLPLGDVAPGPDLRVYAKLESQNPTLSFKDRAMALGASVASDLGLRGLSLASTGNAAVSAAAYAAAAGLPCRVVSASGSRANVKLAIAASYGAQVEVVEGHYSDAYAAATAAEHDGWFNVTTTYRNPVLTEAYRGLAAEISEEVGAPHLVVVPVGAGPLLRGLLHGFRDLLAVGAIDRLPRLVGVQAEACAPLVRAWGTNDWLGSLRRPMTAGPTVAGAIADSLRGYEREGLLTLQSVQETEGSLVALSEEEMVRATVGLAHRGVLVEPAAAAAVGALARPQVWESLEPGATVVVVLTGHGAKESLAQ